MTKDKKINDVYSRADQALDSEATEAERMLAGLLEQKHGSFLNETDFEDAETYKEFIDAYIAYRYEPLVEEYDERKYFTFQYNRNLMRKLFFRPKRKIKSIELL